MKLLVIAAFALIGLRAHGQVQVLKPYENLPKTPDAAVFDKIETNTQINELGVSCVTIPIGSLNTKEANIPITLRYSNTGIKVSDIETTIGLGWVLDVEGVVTRTINGIPDEVGWLNECVNLTDRCLNQDSLRAFYEKRRDSSSDIYHYQLNGKSGYFYFDSSRKVCKTFSSDGFIISPISKNNALLGFYIIDENGLKYKFSSPESTFRRSIGSLPDLSGVSSYAPTAWKITEIETLLGDNIIFEYETLLVKTPLYSNSYSFTEQTTIDATWGMKNEIPVGKISQYVDEYIVKIIKTISSRYCTYRFNYVDLQTGVIKKRLSTINKYAQDTILVNQVELLHSSNISNRLLLEKVNIYGYRNGVKDIVPQKYIFDYNRNLFDFGVITKDKFGYFSQKSLDVYGGGISFFDQNDGSIDEISILYGSLTKVVYPTGGFIEYELEPNIDRTSTPYLVAGGLRTKSIKYFDVNSKLVKKQNFQYGKLLGEVYGGNYWKYYSGSLFWNASPARGNLLHVWSTQPLVFIRNSRGHYYNSVKVIDQIYGENLKDEHCSVYSYDAYQGMGGYYPLLIKKDQYNSKYFKVKTEEYKYSSKAKNLSTGWDIDDTYTLLYSYLDCDNIYYIAANEVYYKPLIGFSIGGYDGIYKIKEKVVDFFENGSFVCAVKNNAYNSKMQLSKYSIKVCSDTVNESSTKEKITDLKYASDYNIQNCWIDSLASNNIIGRPIDIRIFLKDGSNVKIIDRRQYEYNSRGQLITEYQCNFDKYKIDSVWSSSKILSPIFEKTAEYVYDLTSNNLIQQKDRSGIPASYLWGYNYQYPIVKAINVYSESLNKTIGYQLYKITNSVSVKDSINKIKTILMGTKNPLLVLGYTYYPTWGMSSFINQNGKAKFFDYDALGRLISVHDYDNAYMTTYDYKYYDESCYINIDNPVLNISHAGGTQLIAVSSNTSATIKSDNNWITVSPRVLNNSGNLEVTCNPNSGGMRTGKITVQSTSVSNSICKTITVNQTGSSYLDISATSLDFYWLIGSKYVTISSSASWSITSKAGNFISATKIDEQTLKISCSKNTGLTYRSGSITISNGTQSITINVSQAPNLPPQI